MRFFFTACLLVLPWLELAAENITWTAPSTVSTLGVNATSTQVGINQTGSIGIVVWVESGVVKASVYNGTSWGASSTISSGTGNTQPQIVVDATGNAVVVWINSSGAIAYVTRPAAGPFSSVSTISGSANVISLKLAFDNSSANANVIAAWGDSSGNATLGNISASFLTFGGSWSAATVISGSTKISQSPSVAYYNNLADVLWNECINLMYVINNTGNSFSFIDTTTYAVVGPVPIATTPIQIVFTPSGTTGYVTNSADDTVYIIDTFTNSSTGNIMGFSQPTGIALTPNGEFGYVCNLGSTVVSVFQTATNAIFDSITCTSPTYIAITPNGNFAYVTNSLNNTVSVISMITNQVVTTISSASFSTPNVIRISPDGTLAYVANSGASHISVISTSSNTVTGTITIGNPPTDCVFTPNGQFAYVPDSHTTVNVINTGTSSVSTTVTVGNGAYGVGISNDGTRVFVSNSTDNTVSVISTASNTVIHTISDSSFSKPQLMAGTPTYPSIKANANVSGSWVGPSTVSVARVYSINPHVTIGTSNTLGFAVWYTYVANGTGYTDVQFEGTGQGSDSSWSGPSGSVGTPGLHNPSDLTIFDTLDGNGNLFIMCTNSYDGSTYDLVYLFDKTNVVGGPGDILQQNTYASTFSMGMNSLGNAYYAAMDYYINGGYTRIRSGEIDISSYKPSWSYPKVLSTIGTNNSSPFISVFPTPNGSVINAAVSWLSVNGSNTVVQVVTGQETKVQPPTNLAVSYGIHNFGAFSDHFVTLTWTASVSTTKTAYNIYRNGDFIAQVLSPTLSYVDHNRDVDENGFYSIATLDNEYSQSAQVYIGYGPVP